MTRAPPIPVARHAGRDLALLPTLANRHGLIAGATGTGKTVTLRVMAEGFSRVGVPVFLADVKGDLSGMAKQGIESAALLDRIRELAPSHGFEPCPVTFWDVFGRGRPVRATPEDIGPLLLSRILDLNPTQEGVLHLVFKLADDAGLLLQDLDDLRAMVQHVGRHASELRVRYGQVSTASVGAIQRGLLALDAQRGDRLLTGPTLRIEDLIATTSDGRGIVNVLDAIQLHSTPQLYSTLLLWMLSRLFEVLPEVGDVEKPRLVFFFDEAHLLFDRAPRSLIHKVEQVVRLVRSKGVGVYFVTQSPLDLPPTVLGQLGNRVQHALRAFTPRDQRTVRAVAETFRPNPGLDVAAAIQELAVGEALVSFLDASGIPTPVERAKILPPRSRLAPLTREERDCAVNPDNVVPLRPAGGA